MKEIQLNSGMAALVDDSDYEWLSRFKWYAVRHKNGYYVADSCGLSMHKVILPDAAIVDHKDNNGLNNQRSNLRSATSSQSNANRIPQRGKKYKGIHMHYDGRYRAQITKFGKTYHLGCFQTEEEAAKAYDKAAVIHHGEFARLNFPQG